jgi:hypothetical protein
MSELNDKLPQLAEGTAKIKLPGGIVGKACYVLMAVCGALAAIVISIRTEAIGYAAIAAILVLVPLVLSRVFRFADANPELATMDGAEIVSFKRLELAQKGVGTIKVLPSDSPEEDIPLPPSEQRYISLPDPVPDDRPELKGAE